MKKSGSGTKSKPKENQNSNPLFLTEDERDLIRAEEAVQRFRNLGGRPPDYKPEYCEALIRHMAQGFSFESFGAEVGCCEKTLYNWEKTHSEFLQSKRIGTLEGLKWFEARGKRGMGEQFFKPGVWGHLLRNRFRKVGNLSYDQKPLPAEEDAGADGLEVGADEDGL